MKPLKYLDTEKAKLLHELFPDEIPSLLKYMHNVCLSIKEDEQTHKMQWKDEQLPFDTWMALVEHVQDKIEQYGTDLEKDSDLFARLLFDEYSPLFTIYCLQLYVTTRKHDNQKFVAAIQLFFG